MVFSRKIYPELLKHAGMPDVTVLTGMRRTGKTTLIKQILSDLKNKNSIYLDFQRVDLRDIFNEKNYDLIRNKLISLGLKPENMVVAIDEVQLIPDAPSAIKYLYDHFNIKFIITGSSSYYLKNLFSESLAGRKKIFELYPLDFGEFLIFKGVEYKATDWKKELFNKVVFNRFSSYYDEYIRFGGFPQVVLADSENEKKDILKDIFSSYVNIDIKTLADFTNENNLLNLAKILSSRVGSKIEVSKLSSLTGLSRPTINNYLSFFEKTYLIATIPVFTRNPDREIVKARKLYFCDTGIASLFSNISDGSQFENALFNQLARLGEISFYSLKNGNEIDFILDEQVAFEAKETPTKYDYDHLLRMSGLAKITKFKLIGRNISPKFENYVWGGSIL
jgi:hypothetical protein